MTDRIETKPDDAQCTDCSVDEPHPETVMAGGVLCGGCGRRRPAVQYHLKAAGLVSVEEVCEEITKSVLGNGALPDIIKAVCALAQSANTGDALLNDRLHNDGCECVLIPPNTVSESPDCPVHSPSIRALTTPSDGGGE